MATPPLRAARPLRADPAAGGPLGWYNAAKVAVIHLTPCHAHIRAAELAYVSRFTYADDVTYGAVAERCLNRLSASHACT